jgi:epoxyqueuosine reductase
MEKCGIIKVEAMHDYGKRLQERMDRLPNSGEIFRRFERFADIQQTYPWAKSIVVATMNYGHYRIPKNAKNHFGKAYLFDMRFNEDSPERKSVFALSDYLGSLNLKVALDEHPGITAYRWAAHKAGLGIIRQNNFLYTENGSWCRLFAWAIDQELELLDSHNLRECPDNCHKCRDACPTKSLFDSYAMDMTTCISNLTASNNELPADERICKQLGSWVYGCDVCQDVCPMNHGTWKETDEFPGLAELDDSLSPETILAMDYRDISQKLSSKFFYIKEENLWKWKVNALNVMLNDYKPEYAISVERALHDEFQIVRDTAQKILIH